MGVEVEGDLLDVEVAVIEKVPPVQNQKGKENQPCQHQGKGKEFQIRQRFGRKGMAHGTPPKVKFGWVYDFMKKPLGFREAKWPAGHCAGQEGNL